MKRVSVLVASSVLLAFSGSSVEAAKVASRDGCVNLRSQPSIDAGVRCLPSGTNIEPDRIAPSGRFVWKKEGDRVWYYISVSGTAEKGWIMQDCADINGINKGTCTDTGSAAPLANPQQPQRVAQAGNQVGSAECSGIRGDNRNTRPIQESTLEALGRGYTLRFTKIIQGQHHLEN